VLDVGFPLGASVGDEPGDLFVAHRVEMAEAQVLQFPLHLPDTQAVGEGGEDIQRLAGDTLAALFGQRAQRAHVVQAVGQLNQHHAHVVHHCQENLAQRF